MGSGKAGGRGKGSRSSRTGADTPAVGFLLRVFLKKNISCGNSNCNNIQTVHLSDYCQVARGHDGFMELKHNILSFSETSGLAKYNTNLRIRKKEKKKRGNNSNYESGKSQQTSPEILIAFHFQSSTTIAKTTISDSSVITAILCPSAETVQHKL